MRILDLIISRLVGLSVLLGTLAIAGLVTLTVVTVTFRFLGIAFPGTYVLAELLIIPAVTLSLPYAAWCGAHTRVEILTDRFGERANRFVLSLTLAVGAAFWCMVAWAGIEEALRRATQNERTELLDIPVAPFRWLMIGALVLLVIVLLYRSVHPLEDSEPTGTAE